VRVRRPSKSIDYSRRTALYRLFDTEGRLLYVGIAFDPADRWRGHASTKSWWHEVARREVEWRDTRSAALRAEAEAILTERPLYNVAGTEEPPPFIPSKPKRIRPVGSDQANEELEAAGKRWHKSKAALREADAELRALLIEGRRQGLTLSRLAKLSGFSRDRVAKITPAVKS
jgi:DNA-directed RNA polymerase specialized sigma24 family protein